jgi:hypothetical protein
MTYTKSAKSARAQRLGLGIHVAGYVAANLGQILTWYFATPDKFFWPLWSLVFWGIALAFHAWAVYRLPPPVRQ